jgi:hypothetical protein
MSETLPIRIVKRTSPADYLDGYRAGLLALKADITEANLDVDSIKATIERLLKAVEIAQEVNNDEVKAPGQ